MNAIAARALIDRVPQARGSLRPDASLADLTWFRVGGPADILFRPADAEDLAAFLAACPGDVPITVVGVGSNLLVRDGGVRGVVIRLGGGFNAITVEGTRVTAGAAALDQAVARAAAQDGIAGLEFLRGIPGSIGGGLRMNAGAYGSEFKDVLIEARAITRGGARVTLSAQEMGFSYRHAGAPSDLIFTEAVFEGVPGDRAAIEARMSDVSASREATQPIRSRTGGSTFKNPDGKKAWRLIDEAGCRGRVRGDAQVSEMHCNFLINRGEASADDLEGLGEDVRKAVLVRSGVALEWEIKRIGEPKRRTS